MREFSVSCGTDGAAETVAVTGEIDLYNAREVEVAIRSCVDGKDAPVILDFTDVDFMDSTALALLIRTRNELDAAGRPMCLVSESHGVLRMLTLTGMDQMFTLHARMDEAVAAVARPAGAE